MSDWKQSLDKYLTTPPEDGDDNIDYEVFALFTGCDETRPNFLTAFKENGKIYATDTMSIIRCNETDCELEVEEYEPIGVDGVFPTENTKILLSIDKQIFEQCKTDDELTYIGKDVVCKDCCGIGEVEWTYKTHTQDFDCPICDGGGYSERKKPIKTGNKTFGTHFVKIYDSYFSVSLFYKLIKVQELIHDDIYLTNNSINNGVAQGGIMFKIGVFDIVIMPIMHEYKSFDDCIVLTIL